MPSLLMDDMEITVHLLHCAVTMGCAMAAHNCTADPAHGHRADGMIEMELGGKEPLYSQHIGMEREEL